MCHIIKSHLAMIYMKVICGYNCRVIPCDPRGDRQVHRGESEDEGVPPPTCTRSIHYDHRAPLSYIGDRRFKDYIIQHFN